jgi:hypothetical protein
MSAGSHEDRLGLRKGRRRYDLLHRPAPVVQQPRDSIRTLAHRAAGRLGRRARRAATSASASSPPGCRGSRLADHRRRRRRRTTRATRARSRGTTQEAAPRRAHQETRGEARLSGAGGHRRRAGYRPSSSSSRSSYSPRRRRVVQRIYHLDDDVIFNVPDVQHLRGDEDVAGLREVGAPMVRVDPQTRTPIGRRRSKATSLVDTYTYRADQWASFKATHKPTAQSAAAACPPPSTPSGWRCRPR